MTTTFAPYLVIKALGRVRFFFGLMMLTAVICLSTYTYMDWRTIYFDGSTNFVEKLSLAKENGFVHTATQFYKKALRSNDDSHSSISGAKRMSLDKDLDSDEEKHAGKPIINAFDGLDAVEKQEKAMDYKANNQADRGKTLKTNMDRTDHGYGRTIPVFDASALQREGKSIKIKPQLRHDKWIVVTSVLPPTADVKFLSNIKGWIVLVVGDTKTPANWNHSNCIFLSVAEQESFGLGLTSYLPYKSYARKNVGYLYAIAHGATIIYETDDDNRPLDKLRSFHLKPTMSGLMFAGSDLFNPYRHFGQGTLWPRGYPLGAVGDKPDTSYRFLDNWKTPSIQQGVVNGDPDMDAIFRLTRKKTTSRLEVTFDPAAPPVILPEGVFSPFNSQNTLFLHDALWAMLLPTTTTFRMCDIWRGYWSQRLLWEIGGYLAFFPPNAYQERNAHSYMLDAEDEKDMYFHTERLLKFLANWTCPAQLSFFQCVFKLSLNMADEDFWKAEDVEVTRLWLFDLLKVGYPEPPRVKINVTVSNFTHKNTVLKEMNKERSHNNKTQEPERNTPPSELEIRWAQVVKMGTFVSFVAAEQNPPSVLNENEIHGSRVSKHAEQIVSLCPNLKVMATQADALKVKENEHFHDVLLIVVFNWPLYSNVRSLEVVYRQLFPNIIYCGDNSSKFFEDTEHLKSNFAFIETYMKHGTFGYSCTIKAMQMGYNVSGYLVVGDDVLLNTWNLFQFDKNKLWFDKIVYIFNATGPRVGWFWWQTPIGRNPYLKSMAHLKKLKSEQTNIPKVEKYLKTLSNNLGSPEFCLHAVVDLYYVPNRFKDSVIFYLTHYRKYELMLELAVPLTFHGLELRNNMQLMEGNNLYMAQRNNPWLKFNLTNIFLHPVKLTKKMNMESLCSMFLPHLLLTGHPMVK